MDNCSWDKVLFSASTKREKSEFRRENLQLFQIEILGLWFYTKKLTLFTQNIDTFQKNWSNINLLRHTVFSLNYLDFFSFWSVNKLDS